MVQVTVLEHEEEQELEDIKYASPFLLPNIGCFQQPADAQLLDGIAELAFHSIFGIHFFVVFCYHMDSTSFLVFCWISYLYYTRFRCYFVVNISNKWLISLIFHGLTHIFDVGSLSYLFSMAGDL